MGWHKTIEDIFKDPQYLARETITTVDDPTLGPVKIQNAIPRLTMTPGRVRHLGRALGEDNVSVFCDELGHSPEELQAWRKAGVIGGPGTQAVDRSRATEETIP